jgi:hypothetical protein
MRGCDNKAVTTLHISRRRAEPNGFARLGSEAEDVAIKAGEYFELRSAQARWRHAKGEPEGVDEALLHRHKDGSCTHVLRVEEGVEFKEPVRHDFFEEAYYLEGEMLNRKHRRRCEAENTCSTSPARTMGTSSA